MRQSKYPFKHNDTHLKHAVLGILAAACAAGPALGQTAADNTFGLGEVEVIGIRESSITPMVVTTVNAEELAAKHRDDLGEALDLVPGVSLQTVGQRRERLIYVRGFTSRQVPLFIDGVPVYVPYDGNVDLARFGVDYVSEISVSKGLASLLYGPNILGGAVNVISRKPTEPFEGSAKVTAEFDDHLDSMDQRIVGSLGGTLGNWYAHITASYVNAGGYRLPDDFIPVAVENGGRRENADSRDSVISAKIGYAPNAENEYALSYYRQDGKKDSPPYAGRYLRPANADGVVPRFWVWPYWDKESIYFVARNEITSQGTLRWRVFHDSFENALDAYTNAAKTAWMFLGSSYDDYTYGGSIDFEWRWNDAHTTRVATHYRKDVHREQQITPPIPQQQLEAYTYDAAIEHEWRITDAVTAAASYSRMIQPGETVQVYTAGAFNANTTNRDTADNAQLVGTYALTEQHSLLAGVSRKTRFPTLKDRFSGGLGAVVPNPDLTSETARHYEVGYQFTAARWNAKTAVFHSETDDAIQSVSLPSGRCSAPPCSQLQNVTGGQRHRGIELAASLAPIDTLKLNAQATLLDVENRTSTVRVVGIPRQKYQLSGDWEFITNLRLRVDGQYEASRLTNSTGTRKTESFTLLNSFVRFTPIDSLGLELGVRNATDELYAYEEGFYEAGRSWLAQVDYRF